MSDDIPILDVLAEDREAEALRYADAVAAWLARRPNGVVPVDMTITPPDTMFEWPCDRRDAHHPHPEDGCPGVGAHPLTQIGGNYSADQIPE